MIRILMKKQLKMLFSGFFVDRKTGKSRSKGAVVLGIISYVAVLQGCMGAMFGMEPCSEWRHIRCVSRFVLRGLIGCTWR